MERAQIGFAHQPCDTMLTASLSRLTQIEEHSRSAVDAMTGDERRANQSNQSGVFLIVIRDWLFEPIVVAADRHLEDAAHHLHAVLVSMCLNKGVGRADSPRDLVARKWTYTRKRTGHRGVLAEIRQ